ncbi:DUF692 domain-containing protein [Lysobacter rhizosphaerae]
MSYEGRDPRLLERMLPLVDYLEVTLETMAELKGDRLSLDKDVMCELKNIGSAAKIIVHGVSLSIGSHEGWSASYFRLLDDFLDQVPVTWHSEHLGYTKVDGQHLGIMLALPRTEEALELVCDRVLAMQERYPLPFLLEHIVHVVPDAPGDYSPAGFLNAIGWRTGCGLILDPHNLECDAHNHDLDITGFLQELDIGLVREMHLAGGVEHNGIRLDVHSRLTCDSTVEIARRVLARAEARPDVAVYEFMPEAVPLLGHDAIVGELARLRLALNG